MPTITVTDRAFTADSWMRRINRERVVLLGGAAAAVLQAAHPQVALGVARHSNFRRDSAGRLRRTLMAVYDLAFGTPEEIASVREQVARRHASVKGDGYSAFDPQAQLWVLATLIQTSLTLYKRFVGPLSLEAHQQFLDDNRPFGLFFGLPTEYVPATWSDFEIYWQTMMEGDLLGSHPLCAEVANAAIRPEGPLRMKALSPLFRALALEYIPLFLRQRLKIHSSRLQAPLWRFFDLTIPHCLAFTPGFIRYPQQYRRSIKR